MRCPSSSSTKRVLSDRSLEPGARRGADARARGARGRVAAARRALLHAGAVVAGAPAAHDTGGAAQRRRSC